MKNVWLREFFLNPCHVFGPIDAEVRLGGLKDCVGEAALQTAELLE